MSAPTKPPPQPQPDHLWDSDELAAFLGGIPVRTLDMWSHRGIGPKPIRIGRHRRYDPADVFAWVKAQKAGELVDSGAK